MGSGISAVCGSNRSILIANSVRKLSPIHEDDVDSDMDVETELYMNSTFGKLHPAESRDSGIGENDLPNNYFGQKHTESGFVHNLDSSNEQSKEYDGSGVEHTVRMSRPHSCRLGNRGHKGSSQRTTKAEISDSQIRSMVRSAKSHQCIRGFETDCIDQLSDVDDTMSTSSNSSVFPDCNSNSKPKNTRRHSNKRRENSKKSSTVTDIDSSMESEVSDTDMLSIPDETGAFNSDKDNTPGRKGWVRNDDFTDGIITNSMTPRVDDQNLHVGDHTPRIGVLRDTYRIASDIYSECEANLSKKASERSISSIILLNNEGVVTPSNQECCDKTNDWYDHSKGNFDDLVSSMMQALHGLRSRGLTTPHDFENIVKELRCQLVALGMEHICSQSTHSIELEGQKHICSDDPWKFHTRLRSDDEHIIESAEKILSERLAANSMNLTREDISILLAEHLKTIEKQQQVRETGSLKARQRYSGNNRVVLLRRPVSASKLRKIKCDSESSNILQPSLSLLSELPPVDHSKGRKSKQHRTKAIPVVKSDNSCESSSFLPNIDSPYSSPKTCITKKNNCAEHRNDSKSEDHGLYGIEEEDALLFAELQEAFRILWPTITFTDISSLLLEYRKREAFLIYAVIEHTYKTIQSAEERLSFTDNIGTSQNIHNTCLEMGQQFSSGRILQSEKEVNRIDEEFLKQFDDKTLSNQSYSADSFIETLSNHMKKTRLIRVQSFGRRDESIDWNGNERSNTFTGVGSTSPSCSYNKSLGPKRQHTFSEPNTHQSNIGPFRLNSFLRSFPASRQNSYCSTKSRGSTGSSFTYSTSSSISSGVHSDISDLSGSGASKAALSRECSYGLLTEFKDIEEKDEECKTARENNAYPKEGSESHRPPSGRRSNNSRAASGQVPECDKKQRSHTHVHGLAVVETQSARHTPLRKIDEDALPIVEGIDASKLMIRSRPDSGIAVSTSSASYSGSEPHKERELDELYLTTSCQEMLEIVSKVLPEQHKDLKSLVAAITKGLNSAYAKAQALYCWLTSQKPANFEKCTKKSSSPSGRLKQLHERKTSHWSFYMDMLKIVGLKCEQIDGYVKSADYLPGNTVQTSKFQHTWVAVSIDGHFRLVDPQYGAQGDKFVQDHYFATSPDELILSHFPKDVRWQLMNQPAKIEQFEGTLKTWPAMFHFNIRPLNMQPVIRNNDGRLSITVLLQNVAVNPQLEYAGPGPEIDPDTLEEQIDHEIRDVDNAETYHVKLPQEGNYYFTVYAHVLEDCIDVPAFQYKIEFVDELL